MHSIRSIGLLIASTMMMPFARLAPAVIVQPDAVYTVSIDTSSLAADTADQPFALAVQFNSGGTTGVENDATLSAFDFNGGSAGSSVSIFTSGDASGSLAGTVSLDTNAGVLSYFQQDINPGTSISFTLNTTQDLVDPTLDAPDVFSIQLLDAAGIQLPTQDPSTADTLVTITYDNPLTLATFASDPSRTTTGGSTLSFTAPTVSAVPEPSVACIATALASVLSGSRSHRRRNYSKQSL